MSEQDVINDSELTDEVISNEKEIKNIVTIERDGKTMILIGTCT